MNILIKSLFISLFCYALYSGSVYAYIDGEVIPDSGPYSPALPSLENIFSPGTSQGGQSSPKAYNLGNQYSAKRYCTTDMSGTQHTFYRADIAPGLTEVPGYKDFYRINDFLAVKIQIFIAGKGLVTVPFNNIENSPSNAQQCHPSDNGTPTTISTGSRGQLTFLMLDNFVNGASVDRTVLTQLYARTGNTSSAFGSQPISELILPAGKISVQDHCVINDGQPIEINLGDIPASSKRLEGNAYAQPFDVKIRCTGGSFMSGNLKLQASIKPGAAGTAPFNQQYFATKGSGDHSTLGIVLRQPAGIVVPGQSYPLQHEGTSYSEHTALWHLSAAPIADPASTSVPEGEFESNASIIIDFN
ncbi:fimbrial protein [Rosenbergiella nectarea]|nr:fimbrial protein [Rosenbergiella nectarea]MBT0730157.1 fimbrial protein [Rosenbergiella nectarea subsp. apis]